VTQPKEMQRLGKLRASLEPVVAAIREYRAVLCQEQEARGLLDDPEMREMAAGELDTLRAKIADLETQLKIMLVPKDPYDDKPVIIEIRPAAGGDEAALFAAELFRMYLRYCERKRWKTEIIDHE